MDQAKREAQFLLSQTGLTRVSLIPYRRRKNIFGKEWKKCRCPPYLSLFLSAKHSCASLSACVHACLCVCVHVYLRVCVQGCVCVFVASIIFFNTFALRQPVYILCFVSSFNLPKQISRKKDSLLLVLLEAKKRKKPLVLKSTSSKIPGPRLSSILKLACIEPLTLKTSTHSGWWLFSRSGQILTLGRNCFFRDLG